MNSDRTEIDEFVKELVIARLKTGAPSGVAVSFGALTGGEPINTEAMIEHVSKGDEIGRKIIEVQMKFLTSLKTGALYD